MTIDPTSTKVLVTGANGFIGLHTVLHFLKRGYNLCATVRTQEQGEKVRQTLAKHTGTKKLEFTYADLTRDEGWEQAVAGCDYVLHLASPFPTDAPKDENELIIPAREGTLRVLRAAHQGSGNHPHRLDGPDEHGDDNDNLEPERHGPGQHAELFFHRHLPFSGTI